MEISDRNECKAEARAALSHATYDPRRLRLIHTGVVLGISLLCILVGFLLENQMKHTAGLGGVGTRAILETVQTLLNGGRLLLLPFWQIGFLYASMNLVRRKPAEPRTLMEGFRRFLPFLRLQLIMGVIYALIVSAAGYAGAMVFVMTPFSDPLMNIDLSGVPEEEALNVLMAAFSKPDVMIPLLLIVGVIALVIGLPLAYKFRMANYCLLDDKNGKALRAILMSWRIMWGEIWPLVKLDLSFWWFYLLELLVAAIYYLDLLLPLLGVELPVSREVGMLVSFLVYAGLQLVLYAWKKNEVDVTYAVAYETVKQE